MGTTFLLGITIPGPGVLVAAAMAGAVALLVGRGDTVRLARWALVGGWFVFALSSPTSEFPLLLRPLGVIVAGGGAVLYRLARPVPVDTTREPVALPTRLLVVFLAFVFIGCLASPYGPTNVIRWTQGVLIVAAAFYGVSLGLGKKLLVATFLASLANVALTVKSGSPEVLQGVTGPARLAGYMQPNHLAFAAAIVVLGAVWLGLRRPALRLPLLACGVLSMYALLASRSRTGLLALIVAVGCAIVAETAGPGRRGRIALWSLLPIVLLLPVVLPAFSNWFNRDSGSGGSDQITSLTGRTDFWPFAVDLIEQRPVVGWGINVVASPAGYRFQQVLPGVSQAHNSYLEAGLMGGIPGAVAWGLSLLGVVIGAWRLPRSDDRRFLLIGGSILLQFYALTESSPAWFGDMFIIYVLLLAVYGQARRDALVGERALEPRRSAGAAPMVGAHR